MEHKISLYNIEDVYGLYCHVLYRLIKAADWKLISFWCYRWYCSYENRAL